MVIPWPTGAFLTKHGRVLLCIARDPGVRLREIAAVLDITERSAYALVGDLAERGLRREGAQRSPEPLHHPASPPPSGEPDRTDRHDR